jgi:pyruvate/2-oxoglutarate dehydrogenase complex dihydrolipoamide acyltransferase (E2) component
VTEGDRLLEVVAGSVTVDLPSPASGSLLDTLVSEDEPLVIGQLLAVVIGEAD